MDNKLNIQITVSDEQMSSLIRSNLENLPDEKLQEIFSSALTEFLKSQNGQKLFYTQSYYNSQVTPTPLLTKMVGNAVSKDLLKPCVDEFISDINEKYEQLIKECIVKTFSNLFLTEMKQFTLEDTVRNIVNNNNN